MGRGGRLGVLACPLGGMVCENVHCFPRPVVSWDEHQETAHSRDDSRVPDLTEILEAVEDGSLTRDDDPRQGALLWRGGRGEGEG